MTNDLRRTNNEEEMRRKQKKIRERRKLLKNQYYEELANNINSVAQVREVEKEFALAKKYSAFKQGQPKVISNEKLKAHFQQHFEARPIPLPQNVNSPSNINIFTRTKDSLLMRVFLMQLTLLRA